VSQTTVSTVVATNCHVPDPPLLKTQYPVLEAVIAVLEICVDTPSTSPARVLPNARHSAAVDW